MRQHTQLLVSYTVSTVFIWSVAVVLACMSIYVCYRLQFEPAHFIIPVELLSGCLLAWLASRFRDRPMIARYIAIVALVFLATPLYMALLLYLAYVLPFYFDQVDRLLDCLRLAAAA